MPIPTLVVSTRQSRRGSSDPLSVGFLAGNAEGRAAKRAEFVRNMIDAAHALLVEAVETVPCPAVRRHRARARAFSAFNGRLRRPRSVFSDQPEIFWQETDNAA